MLLYLLYSISVVLTWASGFLSGGPLSKEVWEIALALGYTFYSAYFIRTVVKKETNLLKGIKVLLPLAYVVAVAFIDPVFFIGWATVLNPFFPALLLLLLPFFDKHRLPRLTGHFFAVSAILFYAIWAYPSWQTASRTATKAYKPGYDFRLQATKNDAGIPPLDTYRFLDEDLDTIRLSGSGKYTLIETWNERCGPCLRAMDDLHDFYASLTGELEQHYVYVYPQKGPEIDQQQVFQFEKIKAKDRICMDVNLQTTAKLPVMPYFLLFDEQGQLVYQQAGYSSYKKEAFQDSILVALGKKG